MVKKIIKYFVKMVKRQDFLLQFSDLRKGITLVYKVLYVRKFLSSFVKQLTIH